MTDLADRLESGIYSASHEVRELEARHKAEITELRRELKEAEQWAPIAPYPQHAIDAALERAAQVCETWVKRYSNTVITNNGNYESLPTPEECAAGIRALAGTSPLAELQAKLDKAHAEIVADRQYVVDMLMLCERSVSVDSFVELLKAGIARGDSP